MTDRKSIFTLILLAALLVAAAFCAVSCEERVNGVEVTIPTATAAPTEPTSPWQGSVELPEDDLTDVSSSTTAEATTATTAEATTATTAEATTATTAEAN